MIPSFLEKGGSVQNSLSLGLVVPDRRMSHGSLKRDLFAIPTLPVLENELVDFAGRVALQCLWRWSRHDWLQTWRTDYCLEAYEWQKCGASVSVRAMETNRTSFGGAVDAGSAPLFWAPQLVHVLHFRYYVFTTFIDTHSKCISNYASSPLRHCRRYYHTCAWTSKSSPLSIASTRLQLRLACPAPSTS